MPCFLCRKRAADYSEDPRPLLLGKMATDKGPFGALMGTVTYACRHCLSKFFHIAPPDMAPEVSNLLAELHFSNRDVNHLYKIFQEMREHDPITVGTLPNEVCSSSLLMLVRNERKWVPKIMKGLVELGGYINIVPWDGFLYILLQFCTLSKIELCQVLFFIIAKDTKSWSLHMLTNSQLEEFYEAWADCPVKSFCTEDIGFDTLPKTRYTMVDFIELATRYAALINPLMHLQRSVQQSVPSLRFWGDYDRVKVSNRFIPLDFFRFRKSLSMMEMLHEADINTMQKELKKAQASMGEMNLRVLQEQEGLLGHADDSFHDHMIHLPLPGSRRPPNRRWHKREEQIPEWMEERNKDNKDPSFGTALGSAVPPTPREKRPQPQVAKLIVHIERATGLPISAHVYCTCEIEGRPATRFRTKTVFGDNPVWDGHNEIYGYIADPTKRLEFNIWEATLLVKLHMPQSKFYPNGFEGSVPYPGGKLNVKIEVTLPKTVSDAKDMVLSTFGEEARLALEKQEMKLLVKKLAAFQERKMSINRVQELDFIQRSRVGEPKRKNMVSIMAKCRPEELIDRPVAAVLGRHSHGHHGHH